jgi:hypothetical protein
MEYLLSMEVAFRDTLHSTAIGAIATMLAISLFTVE